MLQKHQDREGEGEREELDTLREERVTGSSMEERKHKSKQRSTQEQGQEKPPPRGAKKRHASSSEKEIKGRGDLVESAQWPVEGVPHQSRGEHRDGGGLHVDGASVREHKVQRISAARRCFFLFSVLLALAG